MVGEKSEQKPEIKEHGHKFPEVVQDSFSKRSLRLLLAGAFHALSVKLRR
jgi:hypothetical protein